MKKLAVVVKEKTKIELLEDGKKGDYIDLEDIKKIDNSFIEKLIEEGKDSVYQSKLKDFKEKLDAQNQSKVNSLQQELNNLSLTNKKELELEVNKAKSENSNTIHELSSLVSELKVQIENNKKTYELEKMNALNEVEKTELAKYKALEEKYTLLNSDKENLIKNNRLEVENKYSKTLNELQSKLDLNEKDYALKIKELENTNALNIEKETNLLKENYNKLIKEKDDAINLLRFQKGRLNVKETGEDLEAWCDNEVKNYMQNGFLNCTWIKDNEVIKEEDESKGSKADFIFKIFASSSHNENEEIASLCLDMKDENIESINKRTNESYYKALDKNRLKKKCKYAILVSNLEMDKPNFLPMYKVNEYEDMYVVRPGYLLTFLNMIASLSTKFSNLVLYKEKQLLEYKTKEELNEEFNSLKLTYLDKPLTKLENDIKSIINYNATIMKASESIEKNCNGIISSYIEAIKDKLDKFTFKQEKSIIRKIEE